MTVQSNSTALMCQKWFDAEKSFEQNGPIHFENGWTTLNRRLTR